MLCFVWSDCEKDNDANRKPTRKVDQVEVESHLEGKAWYHLVDCDKSEEIYDTWKYMTPKQLKLTWLASLRAALVSGSGEIRLVSILMLRKSNPQFSCCETLVWVVLLGVIRRVWAGESPRISREADTLKEPDDYKTNVRSRVQRSLVITIIPKQFVETVFSQMVLRAIQFVRKQVLPNSQLRPRRSLLFWKAGEKEGYLAPT